MGGRETGGGDKEGKKNVLNKGGTCCRQFVYSRNGNQKRDEVKILILWRANYYREEDEQKQKKGTEKKEKMN